MPKDYVPYLWSRSLSERRRKSQPTAGGGCGLRGFSHAFDCAKRVGQACRDATLPDERGCSSHCSDRTRNMLVRGIDVRQGVIDFEYRQPRKYYRQLYQPSSKPCTLVANYRPSSARRESSGNRNSEARNDGSTTFCAVEEASISQKPSFGNSIR